MKLRFSRKLRDRGRDRARDQAPIHRDRRVLGRHHAVTREAANNLAVVLSVKNDHGRAIAIQRELVDEVRKQPEGTPLAGYGSFARRLLLPDVLGRYPHAFWFKPATGEGEALAARALVLERDGTRIVWVAVDLIAVDRAFTEAVTSQLARAGASPAVLIISASHTHSGPGAFVDSALMGFVATDRAGSGIYQRATQPPGDPGFTLNFTASNGGPINPATLPRLNVIRLQ